MYCNGCYPYIIFVGFKTLNLSGNDLLKVMNTRFIEELTCVCVLHVHVNQNKTWASLVLDLVTCRFAIDCRSVCASNMVSATIQ